MAGGATTARQGKSSSQSNGKMRDKAEMVSTDGDRKPASGAKSKKKNKIESHKEAAAAKKDKGKGKQHKAATNGADKHIVPGNDSDADEQQQEEEEDEAAVLLREIKSLGGDEADFELVKDVDSEQEDEAGIQQGNSSNKNTNNSPADDRKLVKDLKSFMATLGDFGQAYGEDSDDAEEDAALEEADSEEDSDDGQQSQDDDEEEVSAPVTAGTAQAAQPNNADASSKAPLKALHEQTPIYAPPRSGMLIDPHPVWYDVPLPPLPSTSASSSSPQPSPEIVKQLQARGTQLLTDMSESFSGSLTSTSKHDPLAYSSTLSASDRAFISTILQSGTSSDKLSALILLSSSSPLHTTPFLTQLLALTKKKSRDEAVRAIRAIVDWLKGGSGASAAAGLPDRKLRWFADQPALGAVAALREGSIKTNGRQAGDEYLLIWAFEDWLKKWYFNLLKSIETLVHDPLPFVRNQMVGFLAALLASKPEQEQNLLRLLVDKLGDSDKSVSSRTSYHILQLLQAHPLMKPIIVREVAGIVLRPTGQSSALPTATGGKKIKFGTNGNAPASAASASVAAAARSVDHSKYYGIITLNQVMLSRTEQDKLVANRLIDVYFDIFKDLLGSQLGEEELQGTAGAGNDLKDRKQRRDEKRGKPVRSATQNLARKDRRKIEKSQQALEAESRIMAAVLTGVNRAFPYSEIDGNVLHERLDTLFRIIHTGTFNVAIQAMMLIFQVSSRQQAVSDRFYRVLYDTLVDVRLATCSKQAMYLNLLFKAIKADTSSKRVAAFVKRLTQTLSLHQPPFVCGALYLLGELFNLTPGLRGMLTEPEEEDDEVERFKDVPDNSGSDEEDGEKKLDPAGNALTSSSASGPHRYDGKKRDPQYANAADTCLWEIAPLLQHYHPAVALHASQLLASSPITTKPDLELHTLSHFLDRFVYRNPKQNVRGKETIMKPGANGQDRSGMVVMRKGGASSAALVEERLNTEDFIGRKEQDVPVDQLFFHRYFNQNLDEEKALDAKREKRKRKDFEGSDAEEDEDEDSEAEAEADSDAAEEEDADSVGAEDAAAGVEKAISSEDDDDDDDDLELVSEGDLDEEEVWKAMQASMPPAEDGDDSDSMMEDDDGASEAAEVEDDVSVDEFAYSDSSDAEEAGVVGDAARDSELGVDDSDSELGVDPPEDDDDDDDVADGASAVQSTSKKASRKRASIAEQEQDEEEEEEDIESAFPAEDYGDDDDDDDELAGFAEEDDDVFGSDEDIELDLPVAANAAGTKDKKKKGTDTIKDARKIKKQKLKHLPAFASADDWADLINADDSE